MQSARSRFGMIIKMTRDPRIRKIRFIFTPRCGNFTSLKTRERTPHGLNSLTGNAPPPSKLIFLQFLNYQIKDRGKIRYPAYFLRKDWVFFISVVKLLPSRQEPPKTHPPLSGNGAGNLF
jgi:hypothetical protein